MPRVDTERFGPLHYTEESALYFPRGLPGFEDCRRFVLLDDPALTPLVHLQCLENEGLCFLALPVRSIDAEYRTALSSEDLQALGSDNPAPVTLDLALLSATGGVLTANLLAPVVIDLASQRAVQAVRSDTCYSHQHPLGTVPDANAEAPVCS